MDTLEAAHHLTGELAIDLEGPSDLFHVSDSNVSMIGHCG